MTRWATFDCYGTLIDWNAGIRAELARVFELELYLEPEPEPEPDAEDGERDGGDEEAEDELDKAARSGGPDSESTEEPAEGWDEEPMPQVEPPPEPEPELNPRVQEYLDRYHALEPEVERDGSLSYREVMTEVMRRLGAPEQEAGGLAASLPDWEPFPEVPEVLAELKQRGWKLGILSNSDPDLIAASIARLGVDFDEVVLASEVRGYKPVIRFWTEFYARTLADKRRHVHVAASNFHDIAPAARLRLPTVWINRLDEHPVTSPTVELPDLEGLPDVLDGIILPD